MTKFILRRLILTLPVVFGVSTLVFFMLHLVPGDPVKAMFLEQGGASAEQIEQIRHVLGLDKPLHVQYWDWIIGVVRGDLGRGIRVKVPVSKLIVQNIPSTLQLTVAGMVVAIVLGVFMGLVAALRHNSWLDNVTMVVAMSGVSMPSFWLGLLLIFVFVVKLHWMSITAGSDLKRLVLPAFALGFQASAIIARMVRSCLLEVLQEDYVRTARAKGLSDAVVILRHALRNALIPVVTVVGLQFGSLLSGAVITEIVFVRQGIGRLLVQALEARDFPIAQGCVLLIAMVYVFVNLGVDVLYGILDPRIRYE